MMRSIILFFLVLNATFSLHGQIITTVAGGGTGTLGDGGPATAATLGYFGNIALDTFNNLYIADGNHQRIRKVDHITQIMTTMAGTGVMGFSGDGLAATIAELNGPGGVATDINNNIYIGDANNNRIRKVDALSGIITTYAGDGTFGSVGEGVAATATEIELGGMALDAIGNLYLCEDHRIRKIDVSGILTTIGGNGLSGATGEGVLATTTSVNIPAGMCTDASGNVYFTDSLAAVRKINVSTGIITRVAGTGDHIGGPYIGDGIAATASHINPFDVAVDRIGNLYIADYDNCRIEKVDTFGIISTVAGTGVAGFSGDTGPATDAKVNHPEGVALDACGNLYIADFANLRVRKVTLSSTAISTPTPTISITASTSDTVCSGTSVTYHAIVTGGGASFTYQWYVNGVAVSGTGTSYTYMPDLGDSVVCIVTTLANACATPAVATSHAIHMVVNPFVTPTISIAASPSDTVCAGTSVTYTASIIGGGSTPAFQWYVNGVAVISGSSSYTFTPANGDVVSCTLTSSNPCAIPLSATNSIVMVVRPVVTPTISISLVPADSIICSGTPVAYTASVSNGGSTPGYLWKVNGVAVDTTPSYTYTPANGDSIRCILTSSAECAVPATVSSSTINMVVDTFITPTITLSGITSDPIGGTVTVNATVADAGSSYFINWFNNGTEFATTTVPTVTYIKDAAADTITARIVSTATGCYDSTTAAGFIITTANTGVKPLTPKGEPSIWPNPAKDELHIDYVANSIMSVVISNLLGQALISKEYNTRQVQMNISELPAGIYFVKVNNYFVQKLVKE